MLRPTQNSTRFKSTTSPQVAGKTKARFDLSFTSWLVDWLGMFIFWKIQSPCPMGLHTSYLPNCSWGGFAAQVGPFIHLCKVELQKKTPKCCLPPFCNSVARCKQVTTRASNWVGAVELDRKIGGIHRHSCRHGEICRKAFCGLRWA